MWGWGGGEMWVGWWVKGRWDGNWGGERSVGGMVTGMAYRVWVRCRWDGEQGDEWDVGEIKIGG